jgi:predicted PurR-regulated permease PerM
MTMAHQLHSREDSFAGFARRALFVFAILVVGLLAWQLRNVLLLTFAAALLAVLLRTLATPIVRWIPVGTAGAIGLVVTLIVAAFATTGLVFGSQASAQLGELWNSFPGLVHRAQEIVGGTEIGRVALQILAPLQELLSGLGARGAFNAATATFSTIADAILVFFLGLFFALDPRLYVRGMVMLVPPAYRSKADELISATGDALRSWLLAQFISMAVVGALAWIGLSALGVQLALALAFVAFLFEFVPVIGPIAAAVPAVLVGLSQSPTLGLWVALLYVGIQLVESYALVPLLQRWAVSIPPALTLAGIVVFGVLFGWTGVLVATPLLVATIVAVKRLYLPLIDGGAREDDMLAQSHGTAHQRHQAVR